MRIDLLITGGAMDGRRISLRQERVLVGRDPAADVRFDAELDRQVSARHAELLVREGGWVVRDLGSTNGTLHNGRRVSAELPLREGDRLTLGTGGPVISVQAISSPASAMPPTVTANRDTAPAPRKRRTPWILGGVAIAGLLVAGVLVLAALRGGGGGADTANAAGAADSNAAATAGEQGPIGDATADGEMDYAAIVAANAPAVALIAVQMPGGDASSGTAFAIGDRLLVTNRHVVQVDNSTRASKVLVKFSETEQWLPARIDRVDESADLATIILEAPSRAPRRIRGIAADGTAPRVGDPVALIGFPLGTDTPMEQSGDDFIAAPSVFRGMVSKNVSGVLQVDAFAGHGSSGSPILDRRGALVGVVYGGPREANGRIVYGVSPDILLRFLSEVEAPRIR